MGVYAFCLLNYHCSSRIQMFKQWWCKIGWFLCDLEKKKLLDNFLAARLKQPPLPRSHQKWPVQKDRIAAKLVGHNLIVKANPMRRICHTAISHWLKNLSNASAPTLTSALVCVHHCHEIDRINLYVHSIGINLQQGCNTLCNKLKIKVTCEITACVHITNHVVSTLCKFDPHVLVLCSFLSHLRMTSSKSGSQPFLYGIWTREIWDKHKRWDF